jgi:NAD(P)-dependent dehydrogenase (short-subunit alcohol dehydrogenase family)
MAKMSVIGFTRTLATEFVPEQVIVNAICPGSVEGDRLDRVIEGQAESQQRPVSEVRDEV